MVDRKEFSKVCLFKLPSVSLCFCAAQQTILYQTFTLFIFLWLSSLFFWSLKNPLLFGSGRHICLIVPNCFGNSCLWLSFMQVIKLCLFFPVNGPHVNFMLRPARRISGDRGNFFLPSTIFSIRISWLHYLN